MVYEYSGASTGLQEGVLFSVNNNCDNCKVPEKLSAEFTIVGDKEGVLISWEKLCECCGLSPPKKVDIPFQL